MKGKPRYRHCGVALLRAAVAPLSEEQGEWPDLADTEACRRWLQAVWSRPGFADAVRQASEVLADRIDTICTDGAVGNKQVRRATTSAIRYLLRATGRPTPFGLFAGVAHVDSGFTAKTRWGDGHRPAARVDTEWLAQVINQMEGCPELLRPRAGMEPLPR